MPNPGEALLHRGLGTLSKQPADDILAPQVFSQLQLDQPLIKEIVESKVALQHADLV